MNKEDLRLKGVSDLRLDFFNSIYLAWSRRNYNTY